MDVKFLRYREYTGGCSERSSAVLSPFIKIIGVTLFNNKHLFIFALSLFTKHCNPLVDKNKKYQDFKIG